MIQYHYYPGTVEFDLLDAAGVVYHANYLTLCDRARQKSIEDLGFSFNDLWQTGNALVVYETNSKYHTPLRWTDDYVVLTELKKVSGVRIVVHQKILRLKDKSWLNKRSFLTTKIEPLDEVFYELEMTLVCIKRDSLKPSRIPEGLVKALTF